LRHLQVQKGTQNINVTVLATTPNYVPVKNYTITAGRMFTAGDDAARRRFAVLGSAVPTMLNANAAAMIGQELLIRGIPFEIIGILSEKGSQGSFFNPDEQILIPLQTARYRILGTDRLRSITVKVQDMSVMNLAMIDLERVLRRGCGMIGVVFGTFGAVVLSRLARGNTLICPFAILLAFVFSAAVGLFFGIWPAKRAASLDPIVALRYE